MPGYKGMKQDKKKPMSKELTEAGDVASGTAQKMAQDKKMMQPRKSGIYMDREEGKLPQDRVAKYYQDTNPKMEQIDKIDLSDKGYIARDIAGDVNRVIDVANKGVKSVQSKVKKDPIPTFDISKSGKIGRDIKGDANRVIRLANKGINYLSGK